MKKITKKDFLDAKDFPKEILKKLKEYENRRKIERAMPKVISVGMWEDLVEEVELLRKIIDRSKLADDPEDVG